jgi:NitT/TauT family transport system substrate-binding protein
MRNARVGIIGAAATALILAACSGSPAGSTAPSSGGASVDTVKMIYGHSSVGINTVAAEAAMAEMRSQGYDIQGAVLDSSELSAEGTANGQFAFGSGGNSTILVAMQAAPGTQKFIVDGLKNEWSLYARSEVNDCAGLNGKKVGIFSEGGVSTAMVKNYFSINCPGVTPTYLVLGDSQTRAAALVAGQIDATPVELSDALNLEATGQGKVHLLTSFAETLPDLKTGSIAANVEFVKAHPEATTAFVRELLKQYRKIAEDKDYFREITLKYYPDVDKDTLEATLDAYLDRKLFPVNGGLTLDNLKFTIDFFADAGVIKEGITPEDSVDLTFLDKAVDELGTVQE